MDRDAALAVIEQLHSAQARLYTDGDAADVRCVLHPDIAWHVPGGSPIAGSYRGLDEVVEYMLARRALADGTFRMHRLDVLTGSGADGGRPDRRHGDDRRSGAPLVHGRPLPLARGRVAECWLLPLDQAEFDDIWTPTRPEATGAEGDRPGRGPSGDQHAAGDLPVALPERDLAGEEGIVRRGLDVAVLVERPRRDRVLARGRRRPSAASRTSRRTSVPAAPATAGARAAPASSPRRRPDLHPVDRRAPRGAHDPVAVVSAASPWPAPT